MANWVLLTYRVPREPSAGRVYVWRKLKKLGAVALQDAVWVLPQTPLNREQFQWLAAEIVELGGEASVWEAAPLSPQQSTALIARFETALHDRYQHILTALKKPKPDLAALSSQYQQLQGQDYFHSKLGPQVRKALLNAKGGSRA